MNKMMNTHSEVSGLNNRGVYLLSMERYREAIVLFKKAYEIVMLDIRRPSCRPKTANMNRNKIGSNWTSLGRSHSAISIGTNSNHDRSGLASKSLSFVYKRALLMQTEAQAPFSKQETATVLYNLALSLHLYGLIGRPGYTRFLRKSSLVYKNASKMLVNCLDTDMVFHIVLFNNLGQVYHELGQYEASEACFNHLSRSLPYVNDGLTFNSQEHEGVLLNLIVLKKPCMAAAA